jgi:diguanylate cyclase (GGDEF)-like protein
MNKNFIDISDTTAFDASNSSEKIQKTISHNMDDFPDYYKYIPVIMVLEGENLGERFALQNQNVIIGRDNSADLAISDGKISRHHCKIEIIKNEDAPEGFVTVLKDIESTNGTYINGTKLKKSVFLKDGDRILVGSTLMGFFLKSPAEINLENRLFTLATKDCLTSIYNRSYFTSSMDHEFDRYNRYKRPLSIIIMDIDHFKEVNDEWGHGAGDYVLKEIGKIFLASTRSHDITARIGGEEFAVLLPDTPLGEAAAAAERIRVRIKENHFSGTGFDARLTASFGVATCDENIKKPKDLLSIADQALYLAKDSGRDLVKTMWDLNE